MTCDDGRILSLVQVSPIHVEGQVLTRIPVLRKCGSRSILGDRPKRKSSIARFGSCGKDLSLRVASIPDGDFSFILI